MPDNSQLPQSSVVSPQSSTRRLALNTAIVGSAFVLSRVLGLVRAAVIAAQFGTSPEYGAYVYAFAVPDTLFLIIVGGAVGSAFIPVFTELLGKGEANKAWNLASTMINLSVVLLSATGIVVAFAAPIFVGTIVAPGTDASTQALVTDLTRILLFSPLFLGLGGWAQGILHARQHFLLPALAPVFYNLAIIGGALFLAPFFGIYGLAWGVVIGALLHFTVQLPGLRHVAMRYLPRLRLQDEGVGEVARLLLPRVVGQAAFQINIVAMGAIISFLPDPAQRRSAFDYAYLLMLLPHGVFAMSLATVTFPTMAAQYAAGKLDEVGATLGRAVRVVVFLSAPSAVGLFILREPVVTTLLQLGAFDDRSTTLVTSALAYFSLGLVSYAVVEPLTRGFYALHDTATPVTVSVATVLLNLGLSIVLVQALGWTHEGLALSLAVTTTLEMVLMWALLGRRLEGRRLGSGGVWLSLARSALAALVMGLALAAALRLLYEPAVGLLGEKLGSALLTAVGIGLGGGAYIGAAYLLRSEETRELAGLLVSRFRR